MHTPYKRFGTPTGVRVVSALRKDGDPDKTPTTPPADFSDAPTDAQQFATIVANVLDDKLKPVIHALWLVQELVTEIQKRQTLLEQRHRKPSPISWAALVVALVNLGLVMAVILLK